MAIKIKIYCHKKINIVFIYVIEEVCIIYGLTCPENRFKNLF